MGRQRKPGRSRREGPMDHVEREVFEREWAALSEEVLSGMANWRAQHRRATLSESETELDTRLARMRVRLLERVAQQSAATTWRQPTSDQEDAAPRGPHCGALREPRGRPRRRVRTSGGPEVALDREYREYGVCPQGGQGLFPLDEELGLLPGVLTPRLQEPLAHLGAGMPFAPAARMLARFTGVPISAATARRRTEVVGRAVLAVEEAVVARLCDELPPVPAGPERAVLSGDGAMVPWCRWWVASGPRSRRWWSARSPRQEHHPRQRPALLQPRPRTCI